MPSKAKSISWDSPLRGWNFCCRSRQPYVCILDNTMEQLNLNSNGSINPPLKKYGSWLAETSVHGFTTHLRTGIQCCLIWIQNRFPISDRDPEPGGRKWPTKNLKKWRNLISWRIGCSLLRSLKGSPVAWRPGCKILQFLVIKPLDPGPHWPTYNT